MSKLRLGTKIDGVVAGISSFGVFIKTNYAIRSEGDTDKTNSGYALLHKSQVQDEKVEDISKIFKKGDKIKGARVISINYAKGEVSLSLRKPRPKRIPYDDINVGKEYDGKIANVTPYGAFVDIGSKKNVLLHISRMTQDKVTNVRDYVSEGDIVTIHIIEKNDKTKTLSGSMLDRTSDEYLNKRKKQMQRQKDNHKEAVQSSSERSELEFFEEAIRELEEAVKL
jgi:predicted RNA-binding protein with RPS1 domain